MHTFSCAGWLHITLFEDSGDPAYVHFKHEEDHVPYTSIDVLEDVKTFVQDNAKLSTSTLWSEVHKKHPNPNFSRRSVYNIAHQVKKKQWKRDDDELKSAKILLKEHQEKKGNGYSVADVILPNIEGYSGVAFSLPDILAKWGGQVREVAMDSAWNTNGCHYELYALLGEVFGSGCPLGYLLLQSPIGDGEPGAKEQYISAFLMHFKTLYSLDPLFTLTDKDLSEINAFLEVFPDAKHQLCFWHSLRAVKTRLSILRRQPKYYNVTEARNEFGDAIDKNFVPVGQTTKEDFVVSA
ncbi:hypothetical protein K435DRAFT_678583 [Dendrothele bispora CBS 962.96]|uniref:MULE transposase domain-containing protein n=1 Tax=Dendrothele bispora (strain CBS 962.96) TaxID=1314807 RepID=A0A4S8LIX4_DENBC|nr:hypothetical protein K435DRAFT_678583 [Dendrothele bispora CBS 962.96]